MVSATVGRTRRKAGVPAGPSDGAASASTSGASESEVLELLSPESSMRGAEAGAREGAGACTAGCAASAAAAASAQDVLRITGLAASG